MTIDMMTCYAIINMIQFEFLSCKFLSALIWSIIAMPIRILTHSEYRWISMQYIILHTLIYLMPFYCNEWIDWLCILRVSCPFSLLQNFWQRKRKGKTIRNKTGTHETEKRERSERGREREQRQRKRFLRATDLKPLPPSVWPQSDLESDLESSLGTHARLMSKGRATPSLLAILYSQLLLQRIYSLLAKDFLPHQTVLLLLWDKMQFFNLHRHNLRNTTGFPFRRDTNDMIVS